MTEQKKIPRAVKTILMLLGFVAGISTIFIAVSIGLVINHLYDSLLISALIMIAGLVALQLTEWRNYEVLIEWGIVKPKKKKEG